MKNSNRHQNTSGPGRLIVSSVVSITITLLISTGTKANEYLDQLTVEAKQSESSFTGFSGKRGQTLFLTEFGTGKPDTPACISCHDKNPSLSGKTRAGKVIDPMATSVNPQRFTDTAKIEKWFGRNCRSVIGRECTVIEKGDFLTYMTSE